MKTTEIKTATIDKKSNNETPTAKEATVQTPTMANGLPLTTEKENNGKPQAEQAKTTKKDSKETVKAQTNALNLERTLKLVEELHRRKRQRDRLLETMETLEAFEIAQQEDAEETNGNHFQGCILSIEDDNHRKFSTKNPVIIQAVAQFVNTLCTNRLAEIEAEITIPS